MVRSCTEKLRRQAKAYDGVAATDFFDDPEMWLDVWGEMDWNPVPPALPRLEGIEQADEWQQNNPASQMTAYLVPFLPLHQFGKTAFFLPLLFFFPTATVHHWESSNADLFLPAVRVMRQTAMLLQQRGAQVEYNIEYHKLEQEEISGQTWFAKHCNAVRGACVLKDVSSERKPRVAKLYCGMGTEGTCPNNGFDEY